MKDDRENVYYCPECDQDSDTRVEEQQEVYAVRGENIDLETAVRICNRCNTPIFDEELDELTIQKVYDKYRKRHKLLSPKEIRAVRERYGLSQRGFATLLKWSPNTVARYETGALPDSAHMNTLILIRDNTDFVQRMYLRVKEKLGRLDRKRLEASLAGNNPDIQVDLGELLSERYKYINPHFLGFREFEIDNMCNMVLFFSSANPELAKSKLMKYLFYADFVNYKRFSHSVSGIPYQHLPYGPVPLNHGLLLDYLTENNIVSIQPFGSYEGEYIEPHKQPDLSVFTEGELATMKDVLEFFRSFNAKEISEYSHQEEAYVKTKERQLISYKYGDSLKNFES
ncbi:MAG: DUF4065 domain-containing protein [Firmicutes bacterium]|nr:DUF4065 domain-containing protein [Bacillota bacterium]